MNDASAIRKPANAEFERLVETFNGNQKELARELAKLTGEDVPNYQITRWKTDRNVPVVIMDALRKLVGEQGVDPVKAPQFLPTADVIPLFGSSNASGAFLRLKHTDRIGVVPAHPAQKGSEDAFALVVFGDNLAPRLNNGETAYAVRRRTPFKGQPCFVQFNNGEGIIKIYDGQDERTLFVSQLSPKKSLSYPIKDVAFVHAIVGVSFGPT